MVLSVVGINTGRGQNNLSVPLIRINRCHANTRMCVDSSKNEHIRLDVIEGLVETRFEKRAVPLLRQSMLKHSVTNRMVGAFSIILC